MLWTRPLTGIPENSPSKWYTSDKKFVYKEQRKPFQNVPLKHTLISNDGAVPFWVETPQSSRPITAWTWHSSIVNIETPTGSWPVSAFKWPISAILWRPESSRHNHSIKTSDLQQDESLKLLTSGLW